MASLSESLVVRIDLTDECMVQLIKTQEQLETTRKALSEERIREIVRQELETYEARIRAALEK